MMRFLALLIISIICLSQGAFAQGIATFSYQRSTLTLQRANPPTLPPLPWGDKDKPAQTEAAEKIIAVDIRPANVLYRQQGWMDLGGLSGLNGLFFVFDAAVAAPVNTSSIYTPLDVLWIDAEGKIATIAPNVNLSTLSTPLTSNTPAKAILMLAGGTCAREFIAPNDRIVNSDFFSAPPNILTAPPSTK